MSTLVIFLFCFVRLALTAKIEVMIGPSKETVIIDMPEAMATSIGLTWLFHIWSSLDILPCDRSL